MFRAPRTDDRAVTGTSLPVSRCAPNTWGRCPWYGMRRRSEEAVRAMDEYRLVRMRGGELIGEAERARMARHARRPARMPGWLARPLTLAAARSRRRPAGAGGAGRPLGGWSPAGGTKVAGRTR